MLNLIKFKLDVEFNLNFCILSYKVEKKINDFLMT